VFVCVEKKKNLNKTKSSHPFTPYLDVHLCTEVLGQSVREKCRPDDSAYACSLVRWHRYSALKPQKKLREPYELSVKGRKPDLWSSPGTTVLLPRGPPIARIHTSDRLGEAQYTHCAGLCSSNKKTRQHTVHFY